MITTALLNRYRIKEFIQFIRNSLMIVDQHNPDQLRVKKQYNALTHTYRQLEQAYKQDEERRITPQLTQLDAARDQAIICLRMISEGYTRHYDPTLNAAGQRVLTCINKYGSRLYRLNYGAETAALKNVVRDLQTIPTCVQAVQALHLSKLVAEMKRVNLLFEQQFIEQLELTSREARSTGELTRQTTEAYRTLTEHLKAHATLTPSTAYTLFINHFNENVEHFNQVVERRKTAPDAEVDAPDPSSDETAVAPA